jgi:hypothetical protein
MRPVEHGQAVIDRDIANLTRILRRVNSDPKRSEKDRKALEIHLKGALNLLLNGKREVRPVRAIGGSSRKSA